MEYLHNSLLQSPDHPLPDLLLLDLKLPGMDGLATLASIRADKRLRQIPVYILTDWDSPAVINQARASGAAGFFPKGARFTEMIAALRMLSSGWAQGSSPVGPGISNSTKRSVSLTERAD